MGLLAILIGVLTESFSISSYAKETRVDRVGVVEASFVVHDLYVKARALAERRKWAEAVVVFRDYFKFSMKTERALEAYVGYSSALTYIGRRDEAIGVLFEALEELGKLSSKQKGRLTKRIRILSCVFLSNKAFQVYQEGLNLVSLGKYKLARERFEKALSEEPHNLQVLIRLGQVMVLERDFEGAIDRLTLAKKLAPFEPTIRLWLGRALSKKGLHVQALVELRRALNELEWSELAVIWFAEALGDASQPAAAMRLLQADHKKYPAHVRTLVNLAKCYLQGGPIDAETLASLREDLESALKQLIQDTNESQVDISTSESRQKESEMMFHLHLPASLRPEIQKILDQLKDKR